MKKLFVLCMLCVLTVCGIGVTTSHAQTRTTSGFTSLNDFYKWIDGKTFVGVLDQEKTKIHFKGFWDKTQNRATLSKAKIIDDYDFEFSESSVRDWNIKAGKAENSWIERIALVSIDKVKKTLTISPRVGDVAVLRMVEQKNNNTQGAQGGKVMKGIISGAGSIHMYQNKATGAFWYYYDKKGPNYKLYLSVSEYDQYSGHMVLVEHDAFGEFTGMFDGYVRSNGVYSGTFTNSRGGKFNFSVQ